MPLTRGPGASLSVPIGLELSRTEAQARKLGGPYRARSQLVRDLLDCAAAQLSTQPLRSLTNGRYATKGYIRQLPAAAPAVGRLPMTAKLYAVPPSPANKRRGAPRQKGDLIGSPPQAKRAPQSKPGAGVGIPCCLAA